MTANPIPEAGAGLRERARAAVELIRREPELDRLLLLSYVIAPSKEMLRHSERAHDAVEPCSEAGR